MKYSPKQDAGALKYAQELWEKKKLDANYLCIYCKGKKIIGTSCHGEDVCNYGEDGKAAETCEGWGRYCCRCGASYARNQIG